VGEYFEVPLHRGSVAIRENFDVLDAEEFGSRSALMIDVLADRRHPHAATAGLCAAASFSTAACSATLLAASPS
jgi:hypothetical protein